MQQVEDTTWQQIQRLLHNLLAIEETTPYYCKIEASSETGHQCLEGDVLFQVENGSLTFNFFPQYNGLDIESHQLFAISGQENAEDYSQHYQPGVRVSSANTQLASRRRDNGRPANQQVQDERCNNG